MKDTLFIIGLILIVSILGTPIMGLALLVYIVILTIVNADNDDDGQNDQNSGSNSGG